MALSRKVWTISGAEFFFHDSCVKNDTGDLYLVNIDELDEDETCAICGDYFPYDTD